MLGSFILFGKEIGYYPLMALIGGLLAGTFCYLSAIKRKLNEVTMVIMLLISMLGVLVGGHLLYAITNIQYLAAYGKVTSFAEFIEVTVYIFGGQVFYGGLLGGIAAGVIYSRATHMEGFAEYADIVAVAVPLFHVFGRIGCFLGGCCYGVESDWGITFHKALVESANGVCRVPVQLFEAGFNLILFLFLLFLLLKGKAKHRLFTVYLAIYAVGRFILEFWRGDSYRGFLFGLSTSQIVSILILAVLAVYYAVLLVKSRRKAALQ